MMFKVFLLKVISSQIGESQVTINMIH